MVAAENRQLWTRLTKLTRTNKSLGSHLTKISDTLKQHSPSQPSDIVAYNFQDISYSAKQEDGNKQLIINNGLYSIIKAYHTLNCTCTFRGKETKFRGNIIKAYK